MAYNKEYHHEYYLKNKEKISKQHKEHYFKNKEKANEYSRNHYLKNKEKRKQQGKEYYLINKERKLARAKKWREATDYSKKYYWKNKEKLNKKNKEHYAKNSEKLKKQAKEYRLKNIEKCKEASRKYSKNNRNKMNIHFRHRFKTDPNFKMRQLLGNRIRKVLKVLNKSASTMKLIGCSVEELWSYLESQFKPWMTRENYGLWHVDHIIPCASFDLTDPEQQKKCFHYTNLQPLWAIDNMKKGPKIILGDITSPKM